MANKKLKFSNFIILFLVLVAVLVLLRFLTNTLQNSSENSEPTESLIHYNIKDIFGNKETELADSYFDNKEYDRAIIEYQKFISNSKDYDEYIVAYSLLYQAQSFYELNDAETAKILLNKLIKLYPNTVPSAIGKEFLTFR